MLFCSFCACRFSFALTASQYQLATAVLSIFLFGIEELAIQLEEPFSILPLLGYTDTIGTNVVEIISWHFIEEDTTGTQR